MVDLTRRDIWKAIESVNFMVVGMVSARGEARSAGVMHHVDEHTLWFTTHDGEPKAQHLRAHPQISVTVPIARRVPFMPWVRVPAATITFSAESEIVPAGEMPEAAQRALLDGLDFGDEGHDRIIGVRVRPVGDFVSYGVGVSLRGMLDTERARGRVSSSGAAAIGA